MSRRAAVAALAALAVLPVPAGAKTHAYATRTVFDVAFVYGGDHPTSPNVVVAATVGRQTVSGTAVSATGPESRSYDVLTVCLGYATRRTVESGCVVTTPGRAVTDGVLVPEGATVKARVPVSGRKGGWIEADLRLVANATAPALPPAHAYRSLHEHGLLGQDVPVGATVLAGTVLWRTCDVSGTMRTDRGLKVPHVVTVPRPLVPTSVLRFDSNNVGAAVRLEQRRCCGSTRTTSPPPPTPTTSPPP